MSVDVKRGETLPIHINMTFPSLPCEGESCIFLNLSQKACYIIFLHLWLMQLCSFKCGRHWHVRQTWGWLAYKHLEGKNIVLSPIASFVHLSFILCCTYFDNSLFVCLLLIVGLHFYRLFNYTFSLTELWNRLLPWSKLDLKS